MTFIEGGVRPEETIRRWRERGSNLLTSFDWRDVSAAQHRAAFTVAKGMQADVLALIRDEVDRAIADGITFGDFANALEPRLVEAGWWGRAGMTDPLTGKRRAVQLGSMSRLRTIFQTNLTVSYAQGRWAQIEQNKQARPYLRYVSVLDARTRPEHAAWHGIILPVDDPFWRTHYPPNGWNCRCYVQQVSQANLEEEGWTVSERPPLDEREWVNRRTGEQIIIPDGIDPGWDHNVGLVNPEALADEYLGQKLLQLGEPLATALAGDLARRLLDSGNREPDSG